MILTGGEPINDKTTFPEALHKRQEFALYSLGFPVWRIEAVVTFTCS